MQGGARQMDDNQTSDHGLDIGGHREQPPQTGDSHARASHRSSFDAVILKSPTELAAYFRTPRGKKGRKSNKMSLLRRDLGLPIGYRSEAGSDHKGSFETRGSCTAIIMAKHAFDIMKLDSGCFRRRRDGEQQDQQGLPLSWRRYRHSWYVQHA